MGQPKLLLPWGNTSVLGHVIGQWRAVGAAQIAVVLSESNTAIAAELDRAGFPGKDRILNPEPDRGMFSSIQCAARWEDWRSGLALWAVTLGDQPHLRAETLRTLADFAAARPSLFCQPQNRAGRARHPVVLPEDLFRAVADAPDVTFRDFLRRHEAFRALCPMDDPGLDLDIDTPEDYQRAMKLSDRKP